MVATAVVRNINTARGYGKSLEQRPLLRYGRVRVRLPLFCWWFSWWDPFIGKEGLIADVTWDVQRRESLYTVLFGDSNNGTLKQYLKMSLEPLDD